jgi:tetratricopeptide (TPR) repeat protein
MRGKLAIAILSAVISAGSARADDRKAQARHQVEAADIDYKLGRFTAARDEYTRAYELYPVPPLLFNIGQCHKNLEDYAKAIFFFEGYLRDAPAASNRALVEDLIRESRAALDRASPDAGSAGPAAPPPPSAPPQPATPPSDLHPVGPHPVGPHPVGPPPVGPPPPVDLVPGRSPSLPAFLPALVIGGGVALLAGGGTFYYYGQKRGPDEKYVYDDTRLLGGTLIVAGAAAIVTGAILWLRHPDGSDRSGAPVAALAPGAGYLGWAGTF